MTALCPFLSVISGPMPDRQMHMNVNVHPHRMQLLLAAAEHAAQDNIAVTLRQFDRYDVTVVHDGRAALVAAQCKRYDLLLLDQDVDHIPCDRIVRHLRSGNSGNARTPVIRLTAKDISPVSQTTDGLIDIVLPKSVHRDSLCFAIDSILRLPH